MPYVPMAPMLRAAADGGYAVAAINILNELTARAVVNCCEGLKSPLILQTSTATVKHIGVIPLISFLRPLCERAAIPVAIHLDHCKDAELAYACIDAGWSSVMIDGSHLPLEENISLTAEVARCANPLGISVEGELGTIGGVEDDISLDEDSAQLVKIDDAVKFVNETGVDVFAPAFGTAHGQYKREPKLNFSLFAEIRKAVPTPLAVHGGTGLSPETFRKLVSIGASKINISTALKQAYLNSMRNFFVINPNNSNPLHMDKYLEEQTAKIARDHVLLFGSEGKSEGKDGWN